jgi:hypothetical protein
MLVFLLLLTFYVISTIGAALYGCHVGKSIGFVLAVESSNSAWPEFNKMRVKVALVRSVNMLCYSDNLEDPTPEQLEQRITIRKSVTGLLCYHPDMIPEIGKHLTQYGFSFLIPTQDQIDEVQKKGQTL